MILVVNKANEQVVNKCDAWEVNGVWRMISEAEAAGYEVCGSEITFMGNMVIWVKKEI